MHSFKGKHIAVLGVSTEGCDTVKFLHARGANITCCDRRNKDELGPVYPWALSLGASFRLGPAYLENLGDFEMVVRTPGMSPRLPELLAYARTGGKISSLTKLFFSECVAPIIGVTGTKGKGTTSSLIASILKAAGISVYLGGNVGTPILSRVDMIKPNDWVVLELSSFQLEDLTQSPHIAVVLRTTQEHLANFDMLATNFHPTIEAYRESKKPIIRYQSEKDIVIVNRDDPTSNSFAGVTKARPYRFSSMDTTVDAFILDHAVYFGGTGQGRRKICDRATVFLRGDHNLENIAAACLATQAVGVSIDAMVRGVTTFAGLEHRLEFVGKIRDVTYINDTFSTVPETTIAAIKSFEERLILIVGGSEKKSDFTDLGREIAKSRVSTLIIIGDMTDRLIKSIDRAGYKGKRILGLRTMKDIVQCASQEACPGDVVLLSPACASFDMFKNYKERGIMFKQEVASLTHTQ